MPTRRVYYDRRNGSKSLYSTTYWRAVDTLVVAPTLLFRFLWQLILPFLFPHDVNVSPYAAGPVMQPIDQLFTSISEQPLMMFRAQVSQLGVGLFGYAVATRDGGSASTQSAVAEIQE